jgi:hypothetical protein
MDSISEGDDSTSNRAQQLVAGKLVVYAGEPESYTAFISPEACIALDKYLDFRREHGEEISQFSPLFRVKFDPVEVLDKGELRNNNSSSSYSNEYSFSTAGAQLMSSAASK